MFSVFLKGFFSCFFCILSGEAESFSLLFAEVILVSGKLYLLFCLFIFGCSHKCIPCTSWLWGRAIFSDFPILDFKASFASGGCLCSRAGAAGPRSSCAALGPGAGLRPPSRLGRCCWNWWKRLGSCPAGLARTFFFRRFLGAARGASAGAKLLPDGAAVRGAGARHGPSPPRKCGRKRVGGSARGSGRRGKGGGAGLTTGRAPRKPSGARRPPRASSRCGTETTVMARRGAGLGRRWEAGVTGRRLLLLLLLLEDSEQGL